MPENKQNNESPKDERARAIEKNPCTMCRALGLPICRGHGGGGGGGSEGGDEDSQKDEKQNDNEQQLLNRSSSMDEVLIYSELWHLPADVDFIFEFDDPHALLDITLNMELGLIVFQGHKELTAEEQEALDELFDEIENQFNAFKKSLDNPQIPLESMTLNREGNKLTIKIPSPKYYDAFVQQLMDKNLLPNKAAPLQEQNKAEEPMEMTPADEAIQRYTSLLPNPFDFKNGPKFSGGV